MTEGGTLEFGGPASAQENDKEDALADSQVSTMMNEH